MDVKNAYCAVCKTFIGDEIERRESGLAPVELLVDAERKTAGWPPTGIFVRAREGASHVNADIAHLDKASLLAWLRSRGGDNPLAENVVGILLGHGGLHDAGRER